MIDPIVHMPDDATVRRFLYVADELTSPLRAREVSSTASFQTQLPNLALVSRSLSRWVVISSSRSGVSWSGFISPNCWYDDRRFASVISHC